MLKRINFAYVIYLILGIIILAFISFQFKINTYSRVQEVDVSIMDMWSSDVAGYSRVESNTVIKGTLPNQKITISSRIPDSLNRDLAISFYTIDQNVEVYVDEDIVYSSIISQDNLFGQTPGKHWNFVTILRDYCGKDVHIKLSSPYKGAGGYIPLVYLSSRVDFYIYQLYDNIVPFLVSITTLLCGLFIIICWIYMRKYSKFNSKILSLGLFAIVFSLWSLSECKLIILMLDGNLALTYASHMLLMAIPIPLMLFMRKICLKSITIKFWSFGAIISLATAFVLIILQVFNILDFQETLWVVQITSLLSLCLGTIITIKNAKTAKGYKDVLKYCFCVLVVCASLILDTYRYNYIKTADYASFSRIALLVFIIFLGQVGLKESFSLFQKGRVAEKFRNLAFVDPLTGVGNRTAMNHDINTGMFIKETSAVFMFDLNDLKKCNDLFGHNVGDEYIKDSALIMLYIFSEVGICYRIGGDEFCVIANNMTDEICHSLLNRFIEYVDRFNRQTSMLYSINIACGYAMFNEQFDDDLNDTRNRADGKMYVNKRTIKKRNVIN